MLNELTVGIVFRNESDKIIRCLESLRYLKGYTRKVHIILVDNNSTDDSALLAEAFLTQQGYSFELIRRQVNHLGQARNDVLHRTKTPYVYFTDADCELAESSFSELLKEWRPNSDYAAWGGGQVFRGESDFLRSMEIMRKHILGHFGSVQLMPGTEPCDVEHLSTMHVLYDVSKVRSVSGFNNLLQEAAEDLDLSLRLRKSGYWLRFVPASIVYHDQFKTASEWFQIAFRNGTWQTRLMAYNWEIIKTPRPWPGILAVLFFPLLSSLVPLYLIGLVILVIREKDLRFPERVQLFITYLTTHIAYGAGEIYGIFRTITDKVRLYSAPSSTQS